MVKNDKLSMEKLVHETELYDNPLTEKQKDILDAAEKLFSKQGYSDTPTAEIAKTAGVTEKTLFKHFPTKADLLRRVMFPLILRIVLPTQIKHLKTLIQNASNSPQDIFKAILKDRMEFVSRMPGKMKIVLIELLKNEELRGQVSKIWHDQLWTEMIKVIDAMKKDGRIRKDIPSEIVGRAMASMAVSYLVSSQLFANKWDHEKNIDQLSEILLNGIS